MRVPVLPLIIIKFCLLILIAEWFVCLLSIFFLLFINYIFMLLHRTSYVFLWKKKWKLIAQSCPTLCDPTDCSLPGSSVHGILWTRILEWVAISFSRGSSLPGIKPGSPALQADSFFYQLSHWGNPRFSYTQTLIVCKRWRDPRLGHWPHRVYPLSSLKQVRLRRDHLNPRKDQARLQLGFSFCKTHHISGLPLFLMCGFWLRALKICLLRWKAVKSQLCPSEVPNPGTSLVVPWLSICLAVQEVWVWFLVG